MQTGLRGLAVFLLVAALAASAQAGGIINKQNLSADYIRTLNRNAATDMADAAVFNPAGTAMMQDGFYVKADAIYLQKDYSNQLPASIGPLSLAGGTLNSEEPSIIPGLFAVYKQDRWSVFFDVTVPGGGGKVNYNDGNARTTMLSLPGALGGLGTYLGGATGNPNNINQSVEAECPLRRLQFRRRLQGARLALAVRRRALRRRLARNSRARPTGRPARPTRSTSRSNATDEAFNYFLGLDWAPIKDLNIGLTYMSNTPLNFKSEASDNSPGQAVSRNVGWADGTHEREDLPGYVALGVSYYLIPGTLRVEPNFTYYLEKQATFQGARFQESNPGNSYDVGLALEYILNPQWRFSIGYMHTEIKGMKSPDLLSEAPETRREHDRPGAGVEPGRADEHQLRRPADLVRIRENGCELLPRAGAHGVRQGRVRGGAGPAVPLLQNPCPTCI